MFKNIDTERQLRAAEIVTILTTIIDLSATRSVLYLNRIVEANLVGDALLSTLGWHGTGLVAILAIHGIFAVLDRAADADPRCASAGAIMVALVSTLVAGNALRVVYAMPADLVKTTSAIALAKTLTIVATIALLELSVLSSRPFTRRVLSPLTTGVYECASDLEYHKIRAVAVTLLLVTSLVALTAVDLPGGGFTQEAAADPVSGTTYIVDEGGNVTAINSDTGAEVWNYSISGVTEAAGSPTVHNGTVYVGSDSGILYALDATDGSKVWSLDLPSSTTVTSPATIYNGSVYVGADKYVHSVDAATGTHNWNTQLDGTVYSAPNIVEGELYVGTYGGSVYSLSAVDGSQNWQATDPGSGILSSATVIDKTVFIGSNDNSLYAFDASTGAKEWSFATGGSVISSPTVENGTVYIGSYDESVYAVDATDGTQKWSFATGNLITSSPTVINGTVYIGDRGGSLHALSATDGASQWEYTAPTGGVEATPTVHHGTVYFGANDNKTYAVDAADNTKYWSYDLGGQIGLGSATIVPDGSTESSGSRVKQGILGHTDGFAARSDPVSGQVVDQDDVVVNQSNITVELWGVRKSQFDTSDEQKLREKADDLYDNLSDPLPDAWQPDRDLVSDYDSADSHYIGIHEASDWGAGYRTGIDPPTLTIPEDERVTFSCWDPDGEVTYTGRPVDSSNAYRGSTDKCKYQIERLSPTDEVQDTHTIQPNTVYRTSNPLLAAEKKHHVAKTDLPNGVYRVSLADKDSNFQAVFVKGDPDDLEQTIKQDLQDRHDSLTNQADRIAKLLNQDQTMWRTTVTTNKTGHWQADVPSNVVRVQAQAYDTPPGLANNASMADLRAYYQSTDINDTSALVSTMPTRATPPAEGVRVQVVRADATEWMTDVESMREKLKALFEEQLSERLSEQSAYYEDRLEDLNRDQLEQRYQDVADLVRASDPVRKAYLDRSDRDEIGNAADLTDAELREETRHMRQALLAADRIGTDPPDYSIKDGLLSMTQPVAGTVQEADVNVVWANGTVTSMDDEYYSIEESSAFGIVGQDAVVIEDYPIPADATVADVRIDVVTENGHGRSTTTITNPAYSGDVPKVNAIDLSTIHPGSNERVTATLRPEAGSGFGQLESVEVYAPDGTALQTDVSPAKNRVAFRTAREGDHTIRLQYSNVAGDMFRETIRVEAESYRASASPTVRVDQGIGGPLAVVGDGLESAKIEQQDGSTRIAAIVPGDGDVPGTVEIHPSVLLEGDKHELNVRVLQGEDRKAVGTHVTTYIHLDNGLSDDAIAYVNGEPAIDTAHGEIRETGDEDKVYLWTQTDQNGAANIEINEDPGPWESANWWWANNVPSIDVLALVPPIDGLRVIGDIALLSGVALTARRHRTR